MLNNLFRNIFGRKRKDAQQISPVAAALLSAESLLGRNQFQAVIETVAPVLAQNPDHAEALFMRGTAQL